MLLVVSQLSRDVIGYNKGLVGINNLRISHSEVLITQAV